MDNATKKRFVPTKEGFYDTAIAMPFKFEQRDILPLEGSLRTTRTKRRHRFCGDRAIFSAIALFGGLAKISRPGSHRAARDESFN